MAQPSRYKHLYVSPGSTITDYQLQTANYPPPWAVITWESLLRRRNQSTLTYTAWVSSRSRGEAHFISVVNREGCCSLLVSISLICRCYLFVSCGETLMSYFRSFVMDWLWGSNLEYDSRSVLIWVSKAFLSHKLNSDSSGMLLSESPIAWIGGQSGKPQMGIRKLL